MLPDTITRLKAIIRGAEGFSEFGYFDVKQTSGGWGHRLPADWPPTKAISRDQAEQWLDRDIAHAERIAKAACRVYDYLDEVRQATLTEMAFQQGHVRFPKMLFAIETHNWQEAANQILWNDPELSVKTKLHQQTPARARRYSDQMQTGEWPGDVPKDGESLV